MQAATAVCTVRHGCLLFTVWTLDRFRCTRERWLAARVSLGCYTMLCKHTWHQTLCSCGSLLDAESCLRLCCSLMQMLL